ncbi:MAG: hypothetical protein Q8R57_09090 [Bacteroidota bacterium]|nr:hypothetical protein [Bacteroidota bacterium]
MPKLIIPALLFCVFIFSKNLIPNSVAQVYNYIPLESRDFEVNPAELGLFPHVSSSFANSANMGNKDYFARMYRVGMTSFFDPLNFGLTFTTKVLPNQVSVGIVSVGTGYNFKVNSKLNCAFGVNYKFSRGTFSSGYVDFLEQTAVLGNGSISDGFNASLVLSDSLKRTYLTIMLLNAFPIANQAELFPKYLALLTGNLIGLFKENKHSVLYLESYIKYSLLHSKPVYSNILQFKRPINPNYKYVVSGGTSLGVLDDKYYQLGLNLSFANSRGDEFFFRYSLVNAINELQENRGFYFGIVSNRPIEHRKVKGKREMREN